MKKTVCIFTVTVALLLSVTTHSYGADNVKLGKAPSGILHKYMEYKVQQLSEKQLAYEESFWEQRGTLMAGMTYTVKKMGNPMDTETFKEAFDKRGVNWYVDSRATRLWHDSIEVPILNDKKENGQQIGDKITLKGGTDFKHKVEIGIGKFPEGMETIDVYVEREGDKAGKWIKDVHQYCTVALLMERNVDAVLTVSVGTTGKMAETITFTVDNTKLEEE